MAGSRNKVLELVRDRKLYDAANLTYEQMGKWLQMCLFAWNGALALYWVVYAMNLLVAVYEDGALSLVWARVASTASPVEFTLITAYLVACVTVHLLLQFGQWTAADGWMLLGLLGWFISLMASAMASRLLRVLKMVLNPCKAAEELRLQVEAVAKLAASGFKWCERLCRCRQWRSGLCADSSKLGSDGHCPYEKHQDEPPPDGPARREERKPPAKTAAAALEEARAQAAAPAAEEEWPSDEVKEVLYFLGLTVSLWCPHFILIGFMAQTESTFLSGVIVPLATVLSLALSGALAYEILRLLALIKKIIAFFKWLWEKLLEVLAWLREKLVWLAQMAWEALSAVAQMAWKALVAMTQMAWKALVAVKDGIVHAADALRRALQSVVSLISDQVSRMFSNLGQGPGGLFSRTNDCLGGGNKNTSPATPQARGGAPA
jgi:hypothetical protein